ncbi:MAG: hypothetical protein HOV92_00725 [Streptomyces sp.]|nr:hypothetical protein [Streptomyces sp.]
MSTDENADTTTIDALALLELPALDSLTTEQVRGAACIWRGEPLTADTAVDLGERRHKRLDGRYSTFPRACRRCVHEAAYKVLIGHASSCEQCVDDSSQCDTGRALLRLMREHRR